MLQDDAEYAEDEEDAENAEDAEVTERRRAALNCYMNNTCGLRPPDGQEAQDNFTDCILGIDCWDVYNFWPDRRCCIQRCGKLSGFWTARTDDQQDAVFNCTLENCMGLLHANDISNIKV